MGQTKQEPTLHEALAARGWRRAEETIGYGRYVIRRIDNDEPVCEGDAGEVWEFIERQSKEATR